MKKNVYTSDWHLLCEARFFSVRRNTNTIPLTVGKYIHDSNANGLAENALWLERKRSKFIDVAQLQPFFFLPSAACIGCVQFVCIYVIYLFGIFFVFSWSTTTTGTYAFPACKKMHLPFKYRRSYQPWMLVIDRTDLSF